MGELIQAQFGNAYARRDVWVSKKQLAAHPEVRRSTRWIEQRVAEGLPSLLDGNRRIFCLGECLDWLKARQKGAA